MAQPRSYLFESMQIVERVCGLHKLDEPVAVLRPMSQAVAARGVAFSGAFRPALKRSGTGDGCRGFLFAFEDLEQVDESNHFEHLEDKAGRFDKLQVAAGLC